SPRADSGEPAMSYRAFKRLLGETSLERKCRFLFGAFILLLITGSFWLYARQTEHLAYDQIQTACRLLVVQIVDHQLATRCKVPRAGGRPKAGEAKRMTAALDEFRVSWENSWPQALRNYEFSLIKADPRPDQVAVTDQTSMQRVKEFQSDPKKQED